MEKQFCTIEITKSLEELGFDEECLWYWNIYNHKEPELLEFIDEFSEDYLNAPLWQQAIDWFREKHHLYIQVVINQIDDDSLFPFYFYIVNMDTKLIVDLLSNYIDDYYDAREQAILKAIELCQK